MAISSGKIDLIMPAIIPGTKLSVPRKPASRVARARKPVRLELTAEDLALDQAISAAAARSLAVRRT